MCSDREADLSFLSEANVILVNLRGDYTGGKDQLLIVCCIKLSLDWIFGYVEGGHCSAKVRRKFGVNCKDCELHHENSDYNTDD